MLGGGEGEGDGGGEGEGGGGEGSGGSGGGGGLGDGGGGGGRGGGGEGEMCIMRAVACAVAALVALGAAREMARIKTAGIAMQAPSTCKASRFVPSPVCR